MLQKQKLENLISIDTKYTIHWSCSSQKLNNLIVLKLNIFRLLTKHNKVGILKNQIKKRQKDLGVIY